MSLFGLQDSMVMLDQLMGGDDDEQWMRGEGAMAVLVFA